MRKQKTQRSDVNSLYKRHFFFKSRKGARKRKRQGRGKFSMQLSRDYGLTVRIEIAAPCDEIEEGG
jgi:hypothetical protein